MRLYYDSPYNKIDKAPQKKIKFENAPINGEHISSFLSEKLILSKFKIKNFDYSKYKIGELYYLQGEGCKNFSMPKKVYRLHSIVKKVKDIAFNSLVMERLTKSDDVVFTLSEMDCSILGIKYKDNLELFPLSLDWKEVPKIDNNIKRAKDILNGFNQNDLSTSLVGEDSKTIDFLFVKVNWNSFIKSIGGNNNSYTFRIKYSNRMMEIMNDNSIKPLNYGYLNYKIITQNVSESISPYSKQIDLNGDVYLEIPLLLNSFNNRAIGLVPSLIKNMNINDIINIEGVNVKAIEVVEKSPSQDKQFILGEEMNVLENLINEVSRVNFNNCKDMSSLLENINNINEYREKIDVTVNNSKPVDIVSRELERNMSNFERNMNSLENEIQYYIKHTIGPMP